MKENIFEMNERQRQKKRRARVKRTRRTILMRICLTMALLAGILFWSSLDHFTHDSAPPERLSSIAGADAETNPAASPLETGETGVDKTAWNLILVNKWNYIPDDYEVELTQLSNGQTVDTRIYPALQKMFDDARADGIYPVVVSGYRTGERQQSLMDEKIDAYEAEGYSSAEAKEAAEEWVAVAGTSEHQLGIAVDINADDVHSTDDEVYEWLNQNSYKYGFIRRYPPEKTEITGTIYEPWHYRYVGVEAATKMFNHNLCLEEYLESKN